MGKGWRRHINPPVHVWPEDDLIDHDLATEDCVCGPEITDTGVVVHYSLDGREAIYG